MVIVQLLMMVFVTVFSGCSSHERLYFIEESHIGLKARAPIDGTPGEVDFGYRRSILTLIPKADAGEGDKAKATRRELQDKLGEVTNSKRTEAESKARAENKSGIAAASFVESEVQKARKDFMDSFHAARGEDSDCPGEVLDRSEPLSVISSFNAEVAWFEASRIHTYFATGVAATRTACRPQAIKALVTVPNN